MAGSWKRPIVALALAAGAGALASAAPSQAATYNLTEGKGRVGEGPFGTVTVNQFGNRDQHLRFIVDVTPNLVIDAGPNHAFTFNLSHNLGTIHNLNTDLFRLGTGDSNGQFQNRPFGPFNYAIDCVATGANGCGQVTRIAFSVLNAGSLLATTGGILFAADVRIAGTRLRGAVGAPGAVPLPGALLLMGSVVAGVARAGHVEEASRLRLSGKAGGPSFARMSGARAGHRPRGGERGEAAEPEVLSTATLSRRA